MRLKPMGVSAKYRWDRKYFPRYFCICQTLCKIRNCYNARLIEKLYGPSTIDFHQYMGDLEWRWKLLCCLQLFQLPCLRNLLTTICLRWTEGLFKVTSSHCSAKQVVISRTRCNVETWLLQSANRKSTELRYFPMTLSNFQSYLFSISLI